MPDLEVLVVPVGGGGLISGMALAAKDRKPDIEIVGVQTGLYPSMVQVLGGHAIDCGGQTIAEGIAVKKPGALTREIIRNLVTDLITVEESHIERAMVFYLEIEKTVAEGAGAAALAALLADPQRFAGRKAGLVLSGGNVDSRLLASVIMRGLVRDGRLIRLHIEIPDAPGQLAKVTTLVGEQEGNIVDVSHRRMMLGLPAKSAELDLLVEIREPAHGDKLIAALEAGGFRVRRASPS
jgi:threonine dehydratase